MALSYTQETGQRQKDSAPIDIPVRYLNADLSIIDLLDMTSITHTTQQRDRYEALFENSSDAILIISGGRFVDCNRAAIEMLRSKDKASVLLTHPLRTFPRVPARWPAFF